MLNTQVTTVLFIVFHILAKGAEELYFTNFNDKV